MLLIAAIIMGVFCFTPFATVAVEGAEPNVVFVKDAPALLILNIVVAVLLLITVFMYRNLRQQMIMTILSIVLICASMVTSGFVLSVGMENASPVLLGGVVLLVFALVFAVFAYRGMKHDHKLLRSMDRLR